MELARLAGRRLEACPASLARKGHTLQEGFLGSAASRSADLTLVLEIAMGLGLLVGAYLARRQSFRLHAWCQSAVVLANLAIIALTMVPSFGRQIVPVLEARPTRLVKSRYALVATHAVLGSVAEFGGLYILLAAGTEALPQRFRITRYRLWMRCVFALWWVVILLGLATYAGWYLPHFH
jgi:uncharacterized membrane protein YozB (DUF420 family)